MVKKKQTNKTVKKQDIFVSVVVGVDRNYTGLGEYLTDLSKLLGGSYENYEIIVIDNELKPEVVKEVIDMLKVLPCIRLIRLSREYSYDIALMAGIQGAIGDYVVLTNPAIDPIDAIPSIVEENKKYDIVNGIATNHTKKDDLGRRTFYWYNRRYLGVDIPAAATYFSAVKAVSTTNRHDGHIRHLIRQIGYKCAEYRYEVKVDPVKTRKLRTGVLEAIDIAASHSTQPLRAMSWVGVGASVINLIYALYVVCVSVFKRDVAAGWTTMSLQLSVMFFLLFMFLVVLAEYVGKILKEARDDASYIVMDELSSTVSIADTERKNLSE